MATSGCANKADVRVHYTPCCDARPTEWTFCAETWEGIWPWNAESQAGMVTCGLCGQVIRILRHEHEEG